MYEVHYTTEGGHKDKGARSRLGVAWCCELEHADSGRMHYALKSLPQEAALGT